MRRKVHRRGKGNEWKGDAQQGGKEAGLTRHEMRREMRSRDDDGMRREMHSRWREPVGKGRGGYIKTERRPRENVACGRRCRWWTLGPSL